MVLPGLSVGSMCGVLRSGKLVQHFGTQTVIRNSTMLSVVNMLLMGFALCPSSPLLFAFGLAVFGSGPGSAEVAMNIEGAEVEKALGKTLLPMMHGFYSLGTLVGAGIGMLLSAITFSAAWHIGLIGTAAALPMILAGMAIPYGTGKSSTTISGTTGEHPRPFWHDSQLILIGLIVLAMAFAEGSANDWLPLLMVDGHGFTPGMALGLFCGSWFIDRYSRITVGRAGYSTDYRSGWREPR